MFYRPYFLQRRGWVQDWGGDFLLPKRGWRKDRRLTQYKKRGFCGQSQGQSGHQGGRSAQPVPQELTLNRLLTQLISSMAGIYWVPATHPKLS